MPFQDTDAGRAHRARIVEAIAGFVAARGYGPSVRDLAAELGVTAPTIMHHLHRLRADGAVSWEPGVARSLRLPAPSGPLML